MNSEKTVKSAFGVSGVALTGEPALLASAARMAERQPASSERRAGCPQRKSGRDGTGNPDGRKKT